MFSPIDDVRRWWFWKQLFIDLDSRNRFHKTCDSVCTPSFRQQKLPDCQGHERLPDFTSADALRAYGFQKDHGIDSDRYMNIYIYMYSICIYVDIYIMIFINHKSSINIYKYDKRRYLQHLSPVVLFRTNLKKNWEQKRQLLAWNHWICRGRCRVVVHRAAVEGWGNRMGTGDA